MNTPWCSLSVLFERMVSWIIKCFEGRYFVSARIYVPEAISIKVLWCVVEVWREKIRWEVFSCAQREKRREKKTSLTKKIPFLLLLLSLLFFWKDQNERPPLFFCKKKKEKKSHSPKKEERKEKPNKIYSSRASRNVKAASSAEKKTPTRRIHKARSSSVLMIGFYIAPLRDFYCADRTRIFSLFVFEGREENLSSRALSLSLVWKPPAKTRGKEKKWKWEKNSSKKNIIKNVAARALRKTSVLSFRARHGRDIFVMNRWRSSVFFIWTRMYLYITVYPPLLFCLCFFSSSSSCFFGTLARGGFCLFDQKKRKREELFLRFSSSLFSSFPAPLKETKKRELFFFFYYLTRTNKRTRMRRWDWKVRQEEESKKTTLDWRRCFSFFVVSFCVLVFDQDVVSFREEREKREPPKKPKRKEKILSVQKIRVPLLLLSVPKTSRQRTTKGLQNKFWIVSKTFISLNYNNWAIQIPISVINLNTRTHTYI